MELGLVAGLANPELGGRLSVRLRQSMFDALMRQDQEADGSVCFGFALVTYFLTPLSATQKPVSDPLCKRKLCAVPE